MALDWNKPITIGGPSKRQSSQMPSKTTMNLCMPAEHEVDLRKAVPLGILILLVTVLFIKFGIVDMYAQVDQKQTELSQQQALVSSAESKLSGYDAVKQEYESYSSVQNAGSVDALTALDLVDTQVRSSATVTSESLKNNTLTLGLSNVSLDTIGKLVSSLYAQSIVSDVSVSTAATTSTSASDVTATMVITLKQA